MAVEFSFSAGKVKHTSGRFPIQVRWNKPDINWIKLNTDGSALDNPGLASGSDHNSIWVSGFARALGITTSFEAKLWALRDGLRLSSSLGV